MRGRYAPVAALWSDNTYTGGRVILTGKNQNTLGGQLLSQGQGLSPETANFAYSLPSLYNGAKANIGGNTGRLGNRCCRRKSNGIRYGVCS